jgi:phosphotransferase system  glucose/maltose/N-acetylglucosamine-specific IIC component
MNLPKAFRGLLSRVIFCIVGAGFAMFAFLAIRSGQVRVGRTSPDYVLVGDEPGRFWIYVAVAALMSGVAFYCAFAKGKPDA